MRLSRFIKSFAANEGGATAIEYGLICSLIFVAIVAAMEAFSQGTISMYATISGSL